MSYEEDSGRVLLNFNAILGPRFRKLQDVITITEGGQVMGIVLTSVAMGPEEKVALEQKLKERKGG